MVFPCHKTSKIAALETLLVFVMAAATALFLQSSIATAETTIPDDEAVAELLGDDVIPVTTFGRNVQPLNRVAENVTVITHDDIVRLQARTLDQLLLYYPGVLPYPYQYPGGLSTAMVQGLPQRQCFITMDGIPLNLISEGAMDLSLIPIGNAESIEIVKGPTSSLWGRSVGASISITTREPAKNRITTGYASGTLGSYNTNAAESVVSGTYEPSGTGYLLAGSGGTTDGFQRGIRGDSNAFYGRFRQQIDAKTTLTGIAGQTSQSGSPINNLLDNVKGDLNDQVVYGIIKLSHTLTLQSEIEASTYYADATVNGAFYNIAPIPGLLPVPGVLIKQQSISERFGGVQLAYKYSGPQYWITTGVDGMRSEMNDQTLTLGQPDWNLNKTILNIAAYISGGYELADKLTLTASFRQDWYNHLKNTSAPSVGLIYKIDDKSLLRATYGWGYSLPTLTNTSQEFETLWRVQGGLETSKIPGLWLKANLFYDQTRNVRQNLVFLDQRVETNRNLVRRGYEIELKTLPVFNTTFGAGYTFTDIYNSNTGTTIAGLPRHQFIGSVNWKTADTEIGVYSRYVNFNDAPKSNDSVLWDVLVSQRIKSWDTGAISLRLKAENIFNGNQSPSPMAYGHVPFLVTGGVRVEF